ncbi:CLUMA_CG016073, isoform A [Clunio marinus]|uniref:CLUMA_CG016073, isoform A n=1 Tax=Clunio marinus TaxID=568069 RepID=A0A1J1ISV3_9DIPT|nr:CLUMA_CG016073, isoform A [Clunio marinus]
METFNIENLKLKQNLRVEAERYEQRHVAIHQDNFTDRSPDYEECSELQMKTSGWGNSNSAYKYLIPENRNHLKEKDPNVKLI